MTTSNRWKVSSAELEGMLEGISRRAKSLSKPRQNRIESSAKIDIENKIAEAEAKRQQQDNDQKNYACQLGSTAEVELFRLGFDRKQIKVIKSHFAEYDPALGYWRQIKDDEIRHGLMNDAEQAYWVDSKGKRKGSLATMKNVNAAMSWASGKLFAKIDDTFNRDLLAFRNGTVSTKTGHISPHSPNNYLTSSIPHDYVENAPCPEVMQRYINSSFGGQTDYVRACLSLMIDRTAPHRAVHLLGPSGSGKGAFITLLQNIYSKDSFNNSNSFEIFKDADKIRQFVSGKALITISDITEFIEAKPLGGFYTLVECKPITARNLHSSEGENEINYTRFIIASTGHLAMAADSSTGLERRMVPLVSRPIPEGMRSESMETELINEIPNIVSWALSMDKDLRDRIIKYPKQYSNDAVDYFAGLATSTNSVWAFINECLEPADINGPRQPVTVGYLYSCYKSYCAASGVRSKSLNNWKSGIKSLLPQNIVNRRFVGGESIPTEWVWIDVRRDLFESNGPIPECNVSRLGDDGIDQFHAWAAKYGALYPFDRRSLPQQLAAIQDMTGMTGAKSLESEVEKKSEINFSKFNSKESDSTCSTCSTCEEAVTVEQGFEGADEGQGQPSHEGLESYMQEPPHATPPPSPGRIDIPDGIPLDEIGEPV
jgi:phage/plasmid-associated DNA primase